MRYGILLLFTLPVILLAIWAVYVLMKHKAKGGSGGNREDSTERPELTGAEQRKHRADQ